MRCRIVLIFCVGLWSSFKVFSQEKDFNFKWDRNFVLETQDNNFKLNFGGRLNIDYTSVDQSSALRDNFPAFDTSDELKLRRGRFFFSGLVYGNTEFKLEVEFSGPTTLVTDAYIGMRDIPILGTVRLGQLKQPNRLEHLSSSKYMPFLERSLGSSFMNVRNLGLLAFNEFFDDKLGVQLGWFNNGSFKAGDTKNNGHSLVFRTNYKLLQSPEKLWHIGASYTYKRTDSQEARTRIFPEVNSPLFYLDTGNTAEVKSQDWFNFEMAYFNGPWALQGEYTLHHWDKKNIAIDTYSFNSYYGQLSYFITGEHRTIKKSYGGVSRVIPKSNFVGRQRGSGAWELGLRYSKTDLNSKDIFGGVQSDITLGVNWYLNPVSRLMFNYVRADVVGQGEANIWQMRWQIEF